MRFLEFLRTNQKEIAAEWEAFAGTLLPEEQFSASVLRDSIEELLDKIFKDMTVPQSEEQQDRKSKGETPSPAIENVAEKHVADRIHMGLSSRQLISEFRALRASVIRLWQKTTTSADQSDLDTLTRFNEAVDEALIEAEARYAEKLEQSRDLFLGILGHDLRNPLSAIVGSADLILRAPYHDRNVSLANRILISAGGMSHMITDLMELTSIRMGKGISIEPARINPRQLCLNVLEEMQAAHPERVFTLQADNELSAEWDEVKISQALSNLLGNAVQHGAPDSKITLALAIADGKAEIRVHNLGPSIPEDLIPTMFDVLVENKTDRSRRPGSMGLGLFIAKEIVAAHGGNIDVRSSDAEGTTFFVRLPQIAAEQNARGQA